MTPRTTTIPAREEYDEGKRGPWIKLSWQEFDYLYRAVIEQHYFVEPAPPTLLDELLSLHNERRRQEALRREATRCADDDLAAWEATLMDGLHSDDPALD